MAAVKKSGAALIMLVAMCTLLQMSPCSAGGSGLASYYTSYIPSACYGTDSSELPAGNMFAAGGDSSGHDIWDNGNGCGKVYTITCVGNGCRGVGGVQVKIVDECPNGCAGGRAFDLSYDAFNKLADPSVGVIDITYTP